jgi:hypothetical protein
MIRRLFYFALGLQQYRIRLEVDKELRGIKGESGHGHFEDTECSKSFCAVENKTYTDIYLKTVLDISRVQTRPRTMDFKGDKIRSTPSFGGEVKPSVPCRRFVAC